MQLYKMQKSERKKLSHFWIESDTRKRYALSIKGKGAW